MCELIEYYKRGELSPHPEASKKFLIFLNASDQQGRGLGFGLWLLDQSPLYRDLTVSGIVIEMMVEAD